MLLQSEHDLVVLLAVATFILLALSILGGALAALKSFQVRQFQDLLFKAERKIDTLERRMFNVLNAVPVALVETDATGKFTFANKTAHQLLGRKDSELVGLRFHSATWGITYPDGRVIPADLLPIARSLRGQTVKGFQHMLTSYGSRQKVLVSVTSMPITNRVGEVIGSTSALVELETSNGEGIDDLNGLWRGHWFAAATVPFWGLDAKGQIADINPAACAAFGMTREQALGRNWTQVFVADADFQNALDYLSGVQDETSSHNSASVTLTLTTAEGEALSRVTAWVVQTHEGGERGLTLMAQPSWDSDASARPALAHLNSDDAQELTDHRETERARADLGVGVWHYDAEADTIVEDEGMRRLIGREVEGGPTLIADEDQARADAAFTDLMSGASQEIALDIAVGEPQGGQRWITLKGRSGRDADGKRRIFGVAFDTTAWHGAVPATEPATDIRAGISDDDHKAAIAAAVEAALAEAEARHQQALESALAEAAAAHSDDTYGWREAPVPPPAPDPVIIREADPAVAAENAVLKQRLHALESDLADMRAARNALQVELNDLAMARQTPSEPPADPRVAELEAALDAALKQAAETQARLAALEDAPPPEPPAPDYSAHEARIEGLQAELRQSRDLLAVLERRYVALAETPPPQPDVSAWEARVAAAEARAAKLQAAHDDAQAKLQTQLQAQLQAQLEKPAAIDPAFEARLNTLQASLNDAQREAEASRARLDQLGEALNHAQRFETVGRLTADVAQDFAQMLGVINGALEVMARQDSSPENVRRLSEAALAAGKRGERLTRQLQAFQSEEF